MFRQRIRMICGASVLWSIASYASAQTVYFDVNFNDDEVDQTPLVDVGFPGETATYSTGISGGVIVADGWTDSTTGEQLGGGGDLVATSEAFAITRFNWFDIAEDNFPSPDSEEPFLSVSFDYLFDSELAGGGLGAAGQQNIFLRFYNSESTNIGSVFLKTSGGLLLTDENVEYIGPDDPEQFLNFADGNNPIGFPGKFRLNVDLRNWTYQAFADTLSTPVVPLLDDGLAIQDIVAFQIEHYDTDGDGGARSDSLLVFDNVLIQQQADDPSGGPVRLQAGDADQDLDFDQIDLVTVQIAAKYLTGAAATWGEGDWDGAPGGLQGSPPPGNGLFDQLDIIAALGAAKYLTGPYGSIAAAGVVSDVHGRQGTAHSGYTPIILSGGVVFHLPRVKSGKSTGRLRLATECSLSAEMALHAAAS